MNTLNIYDAVMNGNYRILGYLPKEIARKVKEQADIHEISRYETWNYKGLKMLKVYASVIPWGMMAKGLTFYQHDIKCLGKNDTLVIAHIPHKKDKNAMAIIKCI